jgi:hypothetical protein
MDGASDRGLPILSGSAFFALLNRDVQKSQCFNINADLLTGGSGDGFSVRGAFLGLAGAVACRVR